MSTQDLICRYVLANYPITAAQVAVDLKLNSQTTKACLRDLCFEDTLRSHYVSLGANDEDMVYNPGTGSHWIMRKPWINNDLDNNIARSSI